MIRGPTSAAAAVSALAKRLAAAGIETAQLEAEVLVAAACGQRREWVLAHPGAPVSPAERRRAARLGDRRAAREPLAYVLGEAEFYSLALRVDATTIVPRPETEILAEAALERAGARGARIAVDVGTGCGALAVVMARHGDGLRLVASDVSKEALRLARENCRRHGVEGRVMLVCADLLGGVRLRADCIVANLPYVASDAFDGLAPEVRDFEPRAALDGGDDGLRVIRRFAAQVFDHLSEGAFAAVEVGAGQAERVAKLLASGGLGSIEVVADYAGIERVVIGWREG